MYHVEGTVPSIVLDAGSHTTKAGTGGEDLPPVQIPSEIACDQQGTDIDTEVTSTTKPSPKRRAGFYAVTTRRDNVEISSAFDESGLVSNWDLFEVLLSHTFNNELCISTRENAILFAEPIHNKRESRERLAELLFEKYDVPAIYLARSAVLAAYANGRTSATVLDIGHSGTCAVPIEDGQVIKGKHVRSPVGGKWLNEVLQQQLEAKEIALRPLWSFRRTITGQDGVDEDSITRRSQIQNLSFPGTTDSFRKYSEKSLLEEVKAVLCVVHENPAIELASLPVMYASYELPDGNTIEMGAERFSVAEQTLFGQLHHVTSDKQAATRLSYVNQYLNGSSQNGGVDGPRASVGLSQLLIDTIHACDPAIQRDLVAGVCLTGGTSDLGGLYERISLGLQQAYHKVRILAANGSLERKYCAWTGGSILATFSEFQKNWFSRSEYDENGSSFVHRKCP